MSDAEHFNQALLTRPQEHDICFIGMSAQFDIEQSNLAPMSLDSSSNLGRGLNLIVGMSMIFSTQLWNVRQQKSPL